MQNNFLKKQIENAKENYNYFFIKLIFSIIQIFLYLMLILIISSIINNIFINIIALLYTFYSIYKIVTITKYYKDIINDIKETLGYENLTFEIDLKNIEGNLFKGVVKYGK